MVDGLCFFGLDEIAVLNDLWSAWPLQCVLRFFYIVRVFRKQMENTKLL